MSRFHTSAPSRIEREAHLNWMGGPSFDVSSPLVRLRLAAASCFFGEPMYYHRDAKDERKVRHTPPSRLADADVEQLRAMLDALDPREWRGMNPTELMESAIDAALAFDPEKTLEEAVRLRRDEHIRTTPQVILVRAAHAKNVKGTGLVRKYAPGILARADEPSVGLAYHTWRYGRDTALPNALKKAWADALSRYNAYELAKYRMDGRAAKTVDVMNLVHPGGYRGQPKNDALGKLAKDELRLEDDTWEAIVSKERSTTESWTKSVSVMGHMALLRNLRNLIDNKVDEALWLDKLVRTAEKGQQLPFRYFSAYKAVEGAASGKVLDAIERCLVASLGNLPSFPGRTMALCDNSGSAQSTTTSALGTMKISTIANLTAVLTGMRSDDGHVGIFGDKLETFAVRKGASIFEQLQRAERLAENIGQSTENGVWLFLDKAIQKKEHWDNIFVYSDMQAGHGGLYGTNPSEYRGYVWPNRGNYIDVPKLISAYRAKVNPNVNVFLVQVAGYQDTIVPEFYRRTYILGGWGEGLLRFAAEMAKMVPAKQ